MNMTHAFKWNSPRNYSSWWDEMNLTFGGRLHNIGKTDIGIFPCIIQYIELIILLFESKPSFKGWTICKKKTWKGKPKKNLNLVIVFDQFNMTI